MMMISTIRSYQNLLIRMLMNSSSEILPSWS